MSRRLYKQVLIALMLVFVISLVGCANNSTVESKSSTTVMDKSNNNTTQLWPDDKVLSFSDEALQLIIRDITGVYEGNITYEHVKNIKSIGVGSIKTGTYTSTTVSNTIGLKYLTSLENLSIHDFGGETVELDGLIKLKTINTDWSSKDFGFQFLNMQGQTIMIDDTSIYIDSDNFYYSLYEE